MQIFGILLFSIFISISCSNEAGNPPDAPNNPIKDALEFTVVNEDIPGIVAAIVDEEGVRLIESAGLRKVESSASLTIEDHIHLGSCTKAMTSALLATLVKDDQITWETTIIDVFPELTDVLHEDYYDVTLHQLVTHRGRVPVNAKDWWLFRDLDIVSRRITMIKSNLDQPSEVPIGEFQYSNLGYMIAGSMAERATGFTWEQLMKDRLFGPLEMNSAGFGPPGTNGHTQQPWGHYRSSGFWIPVQSDNAEALGPAGRVHCTFSDWAKFLSLYLPANNQSTILDRDQLNFLTEPVGTYASGWAILERPWGNGTVMTHTGSNNLWYVLAWVAPELNRAFIVGTNSHSDKSFEICDRIIGRLIDFDKHGS